MFWATIISMVVTAVISAVESYNAAHNQREAAEYESDMSERNAEIAQQNAEAAAEEGRLAAKEGHENKLKKRQEAAAIIGQQRAQMAGSGALLDTGSLLDVNIDTAEQGEIDALKMEQAGFDEQYRYDITSQNYLEQATQYRLNAATAQATADSSNPWLALGTSLLGSTASAISSYGSMSGGASAGASSAASSSSNFAAATRNYTNTGSLGR